MSAIIGRDKEVIELNELYNSDKSEFVAVYGRRRVGKTFILITTFGVNYNEYSGIFQHVITIDQLF